ncbi:MAG: hypothetical protein ACLSS7_08850 [Eubacterium ventriosum]
MDITIKTLNEELTFERVSGESNKDALEAYKKLLNDKKGEN